MKFMDILRDSARYAAADWHNVIFLGIILLLTDHLLDLSDKILVGDVGDALLLLVVIILSLLEAGYVFRILEETVRGSERPPKFKRLMNMFLHGIKETLVLFIYFGIFLLLLLFLTVELAEFLSESILSDLTPIIVILFILVSLVYIWFECVLLNMAHHHGTLRSAIDFRKIYEKLRKIGIKKLFMVYIFTYVAIQLLRITIFDTLHQIPYIGDLLFTLIITPFLVIFTTRMLGLIDK